jgi:hypothetical protein
VRGCDNPHAVDVSVSIPTLTFSSRYDFPPQLVWERMRTYAILVDFIEVFIGRGTAVSLALRPIAVSARCARRIMLPAWILAARIGSAAFAMAALPWSLVLLGSCFHNEQNRIGGVVPWQKREFSTF